jgi:bifunctional DNase/RNase
VGECNYDLVSVVFDLSAQFPLLVLRAKAHPTTIGIRVGWVEATLIVQQLQYGGEGKGLFAVMAGIIEALGGALREIEIYHFDSAAFILSARANIILSHSVVHVDMRCSDGVGLAIATGAPILCRGDVVAQYLWHVQHERSSSTWGS